MTNIHPTAVIEANAAIASDVTIGPYCIVGADVTLDDGVTLMGHVVDDAGEPVAGGTVSCEGCEVLYSDGDTTDGLFGSFGEANTVTSETGLFVIPGADLGWVTVDDGGAHHWSPQYLGAVPGNVYVARLAADS